MGEKIKVEMNDWLFNAGIVGIVNILEHAGDKVEKYNDYIEFEEEVLDNFEEKYFKYIIDIYAKQLSWNKIVSYKPTLNYFEEEGFQDFNKDNLDRLNNYIKDVKYYTKSNSYKAAYDLINSDMDVVSISKGLKTIKLKKKETIEDIVEDVKHNYEILKQIIVYMEKPQHKKYFAGKNAIYTIIKNSWNGICFLNPQTKEKNIYKDFKDYFINPVNDYIEDDKTKYKYNCFNCERDMKDLNNDYSFLNNIGFDVSRKSSHVWEFNNDAAMCPICKLIYSCTPAGIIYAYSKGIFINNNSDITSLIDTNNKIKYELNNEEGFSRGSTYRALMESIVEKYNETIKYEISDIQLIRYESEIYKFNILSKKVLEILENSKEELNKLVKTGYKEINTYFNIYELVIDRIFNNQNLFTLIHKLLIFKLSSPKDCRFNTSHVKKILKINMKFMEGMGFMYVNEKDIVKTASASGYYLREKYRQKGSIDKLNGISYRLLNSLKTNNKDMFMDTLLNCYLYAQKCVPKVFLDALKDEENFKSIGYAFVTGLIEGKEDNNGGDNNVK
ncbi:type I-B CRISPR-associated protein Cas8b1/Cst1 [Clostridium sp. D2Q-11]|uniref:Type I-B CRISPR-associated protein Cas8b1/Cst1 n=1 Tax=Anaeromonas frigoriresistens TaxID=2683708 RepID=A0A942Z561_9FIRM|nr:type I-B CRISPR-associated protein Cas8b1/Cst1 [Anaeromonas frigoriresistens]MBS4537081.1 type I-B CRISPR-associated protein Cas8b1/Cst1 [Anaeromonas frigoriresistens]